MFKKFNTLCTVFLYSGSSFEHIPSLLMLICLFCVFLFDLVVYEDLLVGIMFT